MLAGIYSRYITCIVSNVECVDERKSLSLLVLFSEILDGDRYNPLPKKIILRNLNFTVPVNLLYCKEHVVQAVCARIDE